MSQQDLVEMVATAEENLRASHVLLDGHFYGLAAGRASCYDEISADRAELTIQWAEEFLAAKSYLAANLGTP